VAPPAALFFMLPVRAVVDSPLFVSLGNWVWKDDSVASPQQCLHSLPLLAGPCWKGLLTKGVGMAIIVASCVNKLPVILNMRNTRSAQGLSVTAIYGETIIYANCATYGLLNQYPLTAWGENASLLLQALVIVGLLWQYNEASRQERVLALSFGLFYIVSIVSFLPAQYYYILMTPTVMPILLASRGSQIVKTMRCGHTGAQSIITVAMSLVGGLIRILTTLQEMGWDMAVLSTYFLSTAMSLVMFGQYFYYQNNTKVFLQKLQADGRKGKLD
jgi:mannose-P-dolichol utilization defect 1